MGDPQIIKVLIAFGADITALSSTNQTLFDLLRGPYQLYSLVRSLLVHRPQPYGEGLVESIQPTVRLSRLESVLTIDSGVEIRSASPLSLKPVYDVTTMLATSSAEEIRESEIEQISASPRPLSITGNESCFEYHFLLHEIVKKSLSNLKLSHSPEDSTFLLKHMKEARLLQMAGSKILFLDGGGLRGLIHIEILSQV